MTTTKHVLHGVDDGNYSMFFTAVSNSAVVYITVGDWGSDEIGP